jgi:hypothetical protein
MRYLLPLMINACWAVLLGTILRRHFSLSVVNPFLKSDFVNLYYPSVGFFAERCNSLLKMKFSARVNPRLKSDLLLAISCWPLAISIFVSIFVV